MNRTTMGLLLILLGAALAILSAMAHLIGISFSGADAAPDTFGAKQVAGLIVGLAVVAVGIFLAVSARRTGGGRGADSTEADDAPR